MVTTIAARRVVCLDTAGTTGKWVAFEDGRILEVGRGDPPGPRVLSTDGVVLPGMIDAHVHLTTTGIYHSGLDLRECRSVESLLETVERSVSKASSGWMIAGNFDPGRNADAKMPTASELDRISADKVLLISRTDGHSCAVNSAGLSALGVAPDMPGFELDAKGQPTGVLSHRANYEARSRFFERLPDEELASAQHTGCRVALQRGVTSVHEMASGGEREIRVVMKNVGRYPIHVKPYFATMDFERVSGAHLDCIGGDLFLDGSIGSHTAAMADPYSDAETSGALYHSDEEVTGFFLEATRRGLQAGVHAIGDAAIEQAIAGIEKAFLELGPEQALGARRLRHRIEHFECTSGEQVARAARLGLVASVQPTFDRYWGGERGMYAARLGERAGGMNPFSHMLRAGMLVAGGSDSTVTPLDPFLGAASAATHHRPEFAVSVEEALRMFTVWAAAAGREEELRGSIEPGKFADFCVVTEDPMGLDPEELERLDVLETWVAGEVAWAHSA